MSSLSSLWERVRSSLFLVPLAFGLAAVVAGEGLLVVDRRFDDLPDRLTSTVESARSVLSLVAGATLTFAGIAFSVSLLLISAASSQFSPRVVHGLFRDPFNKRVMGVVVGTFVYCLVVIRTVRSPLEEGGDAIVPSISVLVGVLLGVVTILAIVAFINHAAHSMEVSTMLDRVVDEALGQMEKTEPAVVGEAVEAAEPDGHPLEVPFTDHGWVQLVDHRRLLEVVPEGSTVSVETAAGRYAIAGSPAFRIWPAPADEEKIVKRLRSAISIGPTRTLQQDETFGVRQLADVALKAMSPGINDPTTAQDAVFHMGSVLSHLLRRPEVPRAQTCDGSRTLLLGEVATPEEMVGVAFDEMRLVSAGQPTVLIYLLEVIRLVKESLDPTEQVAAVSALDRQAQMIVAAVDDAEVPDHDRRQVHHAFDSKFGG